MRKDPTDPHRLDLPRLAESGAEVQGQLALSDLARLTADAAPAGDGAARWQARGERRAGHDGVPQTWLHLAAQATVRLTCQRCLQPLDEALEVARSFRFVADEAEAERLDEEADEDVLAMPARGRLDLPALLEDELILALPLVPRHGDCPQPLPMPADEAAEAPRENAFAALAALKQRG